MCKHIDFPKNKKTKKKKTTMMILIQDASVQFRAEEASWMGPIYGPKLLLCLTLRTNSDGWFQLLTRFLSE